MPENRDQSGADSRHARVGSVFRFLTELVAWVATPWALVSHSVVLAVLSVVVLIGLPTLFATPGDKQTVIVAVPGWATILVLLQIVAAPVSARVAWGPAAGAVVTALAVATVLRERPRWRRLLAPGAAAV